MKKILILDGYNLIYRARYSGMNRGDYSTIFNFFRGLRPLVEKFNPDECYFVLEGMPKARLQANPDYKGQRVYTDTDNFGPQRKKIISMMKEYFPIKVVKHSDYECDDVANYIAQINSDQDVTIISSDTDFIQTITENIKLYNPVSKKFIEKFSYDYVSYKSLVGDKSDNINGFKGIGPKKAELLIKESNKLKEFLSSEENKKKYENNYFMIKFHDLKEDSGNIESTYQDSPDWCKLKELFSQMEFSSIIGKEKTWNKYKNTFSNLERNPNVRASIK